MRNSHIDHRIKKHTKKNIFSDYLSQAGRLYNHRSGHGHRRNSTRWRRRVLKRRLEVMAAIVLAVAGIVSGIVGSHSAATKEAAKVEAVGTAKEAAGTEVKETEEARLIRVRKQAKEAGYPAGVIELLDKNPATVDYVEDYGEKKDTTPAETVGTVEKGTIPHLLQWDERWGYAPYGTSNVAVSGCGPTCLSMVITGLTGNAEVTPAKVAAYGTKEQFVDNANNTYWRFMSEGISHWGITAKELNAVETVVARELKKGHPIICSVGPGDFTEKGHFIVLAAYKDGKVEVRDPFSTENTQKEWVYDDIKDQIKGMWSYSL